MPIDSLVRSRQEFADSRQTPAACRRPPMKQFGRNTLLRSIFERAAMDGVRRDEILAEIDLDPALANQPGAFIPSENIVDAVEFAAIATKRSDFGLELGGKQDHRTLG